MITAFATFILLMRIWLGPMPSVRALAASTTQAWMRSRRSLMTAQIWGSLGGMLGNAGRFRLSVQCLGRKNIALREMDQGPKFFLRRPSMCPKTVTWKEIWYTVPPISVMESAV